MSEDYIFKLLNIKFVKQYVRNTLLKRASPQSVRNMPLKPASPLMLTKNEAHF